MWQVGYAITQLPDKFHAHRRIKKVYEERRHMVETGEGVDWGMAEALAFGTLLAEGRAMLPTSAAPLANAQESLVLHPKP